MSRGPNSNAEIATLLNTYTKLKHLNVAKNRGVESSFLTSGAFTQKAIRAPLVYLNIDVYKNLDDGVLDALERGLINSLQHLVIGSTSDFSTKRLLQFLEKMCTSKFNKLDLSNSSYLGNHQFVEQVAESLKQLRWDQPSKMLYLDCSNTEFNEFLFRMCKGQSVKKNLGITTEDNYALEYENIKIACTSSASVDEDESEVSSEDNEEDESEVSSEENEETE
jgi:hypothetical protein